MKKNPVVHFEMPYKDSKRAAKFYSTVFDWDMVDVGEQMGNYLLANTVESDKNGRPTQLGGINGGLYPADASKRSQAPSVVISVDSIEESMKSVTAAGGTLIDTPIDIPGIGTFISFIDTEGNRCSMLQPNGM